MARYTSSIDYVVICISYQTMPCREINLLYNNQAFLVVIDSRIFKSVKTI